MAVLYFLSFTQYYNCYVRIYCLIINGKFIGNIELNNSVYCDLRNKHAYLNSTLVYVTINI